MDSSIRILEFQLINDLDIDIAFLVKKDNNDMYEKWLDVVVELDLEYDQLITTARIEEDKFNEWRKNNGVEL